MKQLKISFEVIKASLDKIFKSSSDKIFEQYCIEMEERRIGRSISFPVAKTNRFTHSSEHLSEIDCCTEILTGKNHCIQKWARCKTCFTDDLYKGACLNCLKKCHDGHEIGELQVSNFFCDCPYNNCCKFKETRLLGKLEDYQETFEEINCFGCMLLFQNQHLKLVSPIAIAYSLTLLKLNLDKENCFSKFLEGKKIRNIMEMCFRKKDLDSKIVSLRDVTDFNCYLKYQFDKSLTKKELFNKKKEVEMMTITGTFFYDDLCIACFNELSHEFTYHEYQVLELLCKNEEFCVGFILPKGELKLSYQNLAMLSINKKKLVQVRIPKFEHKTEMDLGQLVIQTGLAKNMDKIDRNMTIIHEMHINFDGDGEVPVSKLVQDNNNNNTSDTVLFNADRPFMYYVKHVLTNTLILVGKYDN